MRAFLLTFALVGLAAAARPSAKHSGVQRPAGVHGGAGGLLAARNSPPKSETTPAAKLLDVTASTSVEVLFLLGVLKAFQAAIVRASSPAQAFILGQLAWLLVVQGSSRLQGVVQKRDLSLNEGWYATLAKPAWTPPNWAFPLAWIPLKIAQVTRIFPAFHGTC